MIYWYRELKDGLRYVDNIFEKYILILEFFIDVVISYV